jgi:hypothetical protein
MESFHREYRADGWRYSLTHRTRPESSFGWVSWPVQRWNGEAWVPVGEGSSYADARRVATEDTEKRASERSAK